MILGPEFQRNVQMRFSFYSVLTMPFLISIGLLMAYVSFILHGEFRFIGRHLISSFIPLDVADPHWSFRSLFMSLPLLLITLFVLGTYEAASSFTIELRNKTWDIHQISAIRPVHLVIGKLLGVTSYSWYFSLGLLGTVLYAYSYFYKLVPIEGSEDTLKIYPETRDVILAACIVITTAFTGHVVAALSSARNLSLGKMDSLSPFMMGLGAATIAYLMLTRAFNIAFLSEGVAFAPDKTISWFGYDISAKLFIIATLSFFLFWCLLGLHRIIRAQLNFPHYPFVWLLFLTSSSAFFMGLMYTTEPFSYNPAYNERANALIQLMYEVKLFIPAFIIFFIASYSSIYTSASNLIGYQKFVNMVKEMRLFKILETIPIWITTFLITVCLLCFYIWQIHDGFDAATFSGGLAYFLGMGLLFMIRDGLVMHVCLLGNRFKRGGLMMALFYSFAYMILPFFGYFAVGYLFYEQTDFQALLNGEPNYLSMLSFFVPIFSVEFKTAYLIPVLSQIAVFSGLFWYIMHSFRKFKENQT